MPSGNAIRQMRHQAQCCGLLFADHVPMQVRLVLASDPGNASLQALNASFERYEEERRSQGMHERNAMLDNTA